MCFLSASLSAYSFIIRGTLLSLRTQLIHSAAERVSSHRIGDARERSGEEKGIGSHNLSLCVSSILPYAATSIPATNIFYIMSRDNSERSEGEVERRTSGITDTEWDGDGANGRKIVLAGIDDRKVPAAFESFKALNI